jgi:hypothetical protein
VPGIDVTNDPLLQGRLFSYLDTQITRLGGPNFARRELLAQFPGCPGAGHGFVSYPGVLSGGKTRERSETFGDHFSQARMFYVSLADWEHQPATGHGPGRGEEGDSRGLRRRRRRGGREGLRGRSGHGTLLESGRLRRLVIHDRAQR